MKAGETYDSALPSRGGCQSVRGRRAQGSPPEPGCCADRRWHRDRTSLPRSSPSVWWSRVRPFLQVEALGTGLGQRPAGKLALEGPVRCSRRARWTGARLEEDADHRLALVLGERGLIGLVVRQAIGRKLKLGIEDARQKKRG